MIRRRHPQENIENEIKEIDLNKCLAKTEEDEDNKTVPGMNIEEHSFLTGYIAREIAKRFPNLIENNLVPEGYETIVALHDIGKISKVFQWKIYNSLSDPALIPSFVTKPRVNMSSSAFSHTLVGQSYFNDMLKNPAGGRIIAAHHGRCLNLSHNATDNVFGGTAYNEAREKLQAKVERAFKHKVPTLELFPYTEEHAFLTGLTIVSDRISSSRTLSELKEYGYQKLAEIAIREVWF